MHSGKSGKPLKRDVPRERVDRVAAHGLAPGGGARLGRVDAAALVLGALLERADLLHVAALVGPVDERHPDDDAHDHAGRGDGEPEVDAVLPAERAEALGHPAHGAVAALEPDLEQVAEGRRHAEERDEQEARQAEPEDVLPPGEQLPEAQLRERDADDLPEPRRGDAEEERREDDVDEEARELLRGGDPLRRDVRAEETDGGEADEPADDGAREVEPLQERDVHADDLSADEQEREDGEDGYGEHGAEGRAPGGARRAPPRRVRGARSSTSC